jgi:hypothetical protein
MAWMALGGTRSKIEPMILNLIGTTAVLGEARGTGGNPDSPDANMLSIAKKLCAETLGIQLQTGPTGQDELQPVKPVLPDIGHPNWKSATVLVRANGDAEAWQRLCGYANKRPIQLLRLGIDADGKQVLTGELYSAGRFPEMGMLGDQNGKIQTGHSQENLFPWCMVAADDAAKEAAKNFAKRDVPFCPQEWVALTSQRMSNDDLSRWIVRGAINAGFAAFVYIDRALKDLSQNKKPQPPYDRCDQLEVGK